MTTAPRPDDTATRHHRPQGEEVVVADDRLSVRRRRW